METVEKAGGADWELSNFQEGSSCAYSDAEASCRVWLEIEGFSRFLIALRRIGAQHFPGHSVNGQEQLRAFSPADGSAVSVDLSKVEIQLAETRSVFEQIRLLYQAYSRVRAAAAKANLKLPAGQRIRVIASNADALGENSHGSHDSYLITAACWRRLFGPALRYRLFLASFFVTMVLFTGQGVVVPDPRKGARYLLSSRARFVQRLETWSTTGPRGILNLRDEPLAGARTGDLRRLHVILFDSNLAETALLLRWGLPRLALAAIEAGFSPNPRMILNDPVAALFQLNADRHALLETLDKQCHAALELQAHYLHALRRFFPRVDRHVVSEMREIFECWAEAVRHMQEAHLEATPALACRFDWALKAGILRTALTWSPGLGFKELALVDHAYADLEDGLFFQYRAAGMTKKLAPMHPGPPTDSRAWLRAELLRRFGGSCRLEAPGRRRCPLEDIDWDGMSFRRGDYVRHLDLKGPLDFSRNACGHVFTGSPSLDTALDRLGATPPAHAPLLAAGYANPAPHAGTMNGDGITQEHGQNAAPASAAGGRVRDGEKETTR